MTWFEELCVLAFAVGEIRSSGVSLPTFKGEPLDTWLTRAVAKIERETLPRPLFEDGEPVQFGDEFVAWNGTVGTVSAINVVDNARLIIINSSSSNNYIVGAKDSHGRFAKRPEPPDTWERIEADVDSGKGYAGMDAAEVAADVLRRCKALAGVE